METMDTEKLNIPIDNDKVEANSPEKGAILVELSSSNSPSHSSIINNEVDIVDKEVIFVSDNNKEIKELVDTSKKSTNITEKSNEIEKEVANVKTSELSSGTLDLIKNSVDRTIEDTLSDVNNEKGEEKGFGTDSVGVHMSEPMDGTSSKENVVLKTENVISSTSMSNEEHPTSQHSNESVENNVSNLSHQLDNMKIMDPDLSKGEQVGKTDDDKIIDLFDGVKISEDTNTNVVQKSSDLEKTENLNDHENEFSEDENDDDNMRTETEEADEELSERECGDGEGEQDPQKKLDNDEDKRNPEFIPRKGAFYEHDTRTDDNYNEDVKEEPKPERKKISKLEEKGKKHSSEGKWGHDLYNELEQSPKTAQELIDTYGYDIRNEDHPPKSRRPRRYGRGPNKYERSWEDQNAYIKQNDNRTPRRANKEAPSSRKIYNEKTSGTEKSVEREEFPPLVKNKEVVKEEKVVFQDKIGMRCEVEGKVNPPPPPFSQKNVVKKTSTRSTASQHNSNNYNSTNNQNENKISNRYSPSRGPNLLKHSPPKPEGNVGRPRLGPVIQHVDRKSQSRHESIHKTESSSGARSRQGQMTHNTESGSRQVSTENVIGGRGSWLNNIKTNQELNEFHIGNSKLRSGVDGQISNTPTVGLAGHKQEDQNLRETSSLGGKRYSVQRQRSIPEPNKTPAYITNSPQVAINSSIPLNVPQGLRTAGPNELPDQTFYHQSTGTAPLHTVHQATLSNSEQIYHAKAYPSQTPVYQESAPAPIYQESIQNIPSGSGQTILLPMHYVSPPPSQVPPFTNTQATPINYAPQPQPSLQYQPIVNIQPPPQSEIFQPPGGITYYSPQTQAVVHRPAPPQRRIKTAIPIVPPNEVRMRHPHQQGNVSQHPI